MHVPDGPITTEVCLAAGAVSLGAVGYSLHRLKDSLADRTVPLTGMMAALIFAGQMVNFPIALFGIPSYSGHLMGGVLAAVILGPWAGCVAITLVLIVQCLLFADGGLAALGVNVLNMGVVGALGGYAVYALVRRILGNGARGAIAGVVIASWLSVVAASALFCLEFGLSHIDGGVYTPSDLLRLVTLMITVHSVIGVGESLITGMAISFVLSHRPDLLYAVTPGTAESLARRAGRTLAAGLVFALALAAFLSPFASHLDDGLVWIGKQTGFEQLESSHVLVFGGYDQVLPPGWQKLSVSLAGIIGTLSVFVIALLLDRSLRLRARAVEVKHE